MDDKEAIEELIDYAGAGIPSVLATHAINAINTLAKVREALRAWNASEDTSSADDLEVKIASIVR
jgi:hypothetical protein